MQLLTAYFFSEFEILTQSARIKTDFSLKGWGGSAPPTLHRLGRHTRPRASTDAKSHNLINKYNISKNTQFCKAHLLVKDS